MTGDSTGVEFLAFHDAVTGRWIGSFGRLDTLVSHLAGLTCTRTWKDLTVIRSGLNVGSMQDFRDNWAMENG